MPPNIGTERHVEIAASVVSPAQRRKAFIGAAVGNAIEWYDFAVYGVVAAHVGAAFFPSDDPVAELLSSFAVFGLSFLVRPLGGLFFGPLADRIGRKRVMVTVLVMMSVATAGIGLLPTFASWGLMAPVLLILLRCLQGFSAGGEFGSVSSFMVEYSGKNRRGFGTSWMMFSTICSFMFGSAVAAALVFGLGETQMSEWGWRVPFLIAAPLGGIALYIRLRLEDSPAFAALEKSGDVSAAPLREAFSYRRQLLVTAGIATLHATAFYIVFTFMVGFISTTIGRGSSMALVSTFIAGALGLTIIPFAGALSDRVGRRPVLLAGGLGFLILSYPMFALVSTGHVLAIIVGQAVLAALLATFISTSVVTMVEIYPTRVRSAGTSIGYNIPTAIFGGMAPFAATYLVSQTGDNRAPSFYLIAAAIVGLVAVLALARIPRADAQASTMDQGDA
jgi:MHS family proline/betaine transporter-like MFS transporter